MISVRVGVAPVLHGTTQVWVDALRACRGGTLPDLQRCKRKAPNIFRVIPGRHLERVEGKLVLLLGCGGYPKDRDSP